VRSGTRRAPTVRGPPSGFGSTITAPYHRHVIAPPPFARPVRGVGSAAQNVRIERLPELDGMLPTDASEAFRDLPGLALLDSSRPHAGRGWSYLSADPVAIATRPDRPRQPFSEAHRLLARLDGRPLAGQAGAPPFIGGLLGYVAYELGALLEPRVTPVPDDQRLPILRLALHDWVIAWDVRSGRAWLGGRAVDGDPAALERRLDVVQGRVAELLFGRRPAFAPAFDLPQLALRSNLSRGAYEDRVERIRAAIAAGDLYQANLTRRLEANFSDDPWPLYRRLRQGDPAPFGAYLDLGRNDDGPRAIMSASPEAFLRVDAGGTIRTDPIKGTRPRGRDRDEDRSLTCDLLSSPKDRAENVMIVDVLRNDLGRVATPGSVRVPRLCRLERTGAVQHLVSRVEARLRPGIDPFDILIATFPGGSVTGAPKVRAMELIGELEPVGRGPYTGTLGWIGPDGAMATSILIRTFVADGRRLTLHVGGGITWRSKPADEWAETVAKARGPLRAIGAYEIAS
jgi:para-aminobenzoate synthetase component 1